MNIKEEIEEYKKIYKSRMRKILEENSCVVQTMDSQNIVTLSYYMRKNALMNSYPILEEVLKVFSDEAASDEFILSMLKSNVDAAFKKK